MELPQPCPVTDVETCDSSESPSTAAHALQHLLMPLTYLAHRSFFPGNAGHLDYDRLCKGREELPPKTDTITTPVGSIVGFHEYVNPNQNAQSNVVIILAHGNTRPTRFMKDLITELLQCSPSIKAVVGRDFVGYDASSHVPFHNGALEIAAQANDRAVLERLTEKYPDCRFILCGRSVGTFFWTGQLQHPKVVGAIGIVPLTSPVSVIQNVLQTSTPSFLRRLTTLSGLASTVAAATFPSGYTAPSLPGFTTEGFEVRTVDPGVHGKQVVLFPSADDELIPKGNVEDIQSKLEGAGCKVEVEWTSGGHRALPSLLQLKEAVELILRE